MTKYYRVSPEAAGDIGELTEHDGTKRPPDCSTTHKLHHKFKSWRGDDIVGCNNFVLITESLKNIIESKSLSGFEIEDLVTTKHEKFEKLQPETELPEFYWLRVTGHPTVDDFGMSYNDQLIVSEEALNVLRQVNHQHADINEYDRSYPTDSW